MKVFDIVMPSSKIVRVMATLQKRRENKPPKQQTADERKKSFIDMFAGMTDYPTVGVAGSVNPDTNP